MNTRKKSRRLKIECLELRIVLEGSNLGSFDFEIDDRTGIIERNRLQHLEISSLLDVEKLVYAGDPNGFPPDSPADRIDPNTLDSMFAGVGSLSIVPNPSEPVRFLCSGTAVSPTHVLSAAHCLDVEDNDGTIDVLPENVLFRLNVPAIDENGNETPHISIPAVSLTIHPNFSGFRLPSISNDISIIELSSPLPDGVPFYRLNTEPFETIEEITIAGYGTTGDGVNGDISGSASLETKRTGRNRAEFFDMENEETDGPEIFAFDFDGPTSDSNYYGPPTEDNLSLGNNIETTLGPGDSGGPSFVIHNGEMEIFGVNTFRSRLKAAAPLFGSGGGGIVVSEYASWIDSIINNTSHEDPTNSNRTDESFPIAFDLSLVVSPTAVDAQGKIDSLPENEEWIDEWTSFYIEVWVSTPETIDQEIATASLSLTYDRSFFTSTGIEYGPGFLGNPIEMINPSEVSLENLGGTSSEEMIGDDRFALLARIKFDSLKGDNVPFNGFGQYIQPVDTPWLSLADTKIELSGETSSTIEENELPQTELWPVMYDMDDSGEISFGDLSFFASVFTQSTETSSNDAVFASDFDRSGTVDYGDVSFLAANFQVKQTDDKRVLYPANFPEQWRIDNLIAKFAADFATSRRKDSFSQNRQDTYITEDNPASVNDRIISSEIISDELIQIDKFNHLPDKSIQKDFQKPVPEQLNSDIDYSYDLVTWAANDRRNARSL